MVYFPAEDFLMVSTCVVSLLATVISSRWWRTMSAPLLYPKLHRLTRRRARLGKKDPSNVLELKRINAEIAGLAGVRRSVVGLIILWTVFLFSRFAYLLPLWGLFGSMEVVVLPQYQFMGIPRRLFVGATPEDLLNNILVAMRTMTIPPAPTGPLAYRDEWMRSMGVVGWAAICHVVWVTILPVH